jgi:hypothetical protein
MKVEIINVTPQQASDWLKVNTTNRPLRRSVVDGLKSALMRGEYIQTHQGIAFAESGELLDGQHRLTAISELRDGNYPMVVAFDVPAMAFQVMDIGVKRTAADSLRIEDRRIVEVARLIAMICQTNKGMVTPTMLLPIIAEIEPFHSSLTAFCSTSVKTWSSAPVRLACCMLMMNGADADYVRILYRAMIVGDFEAMPKGVQSLYRAGHDGRVRASDHSDMIARVLAAFDVRKATNNRIMVRDPMAAPGEVRRLFGHLIKREAEMDKKKGTVKTAPKGVLQRNSTSRARAS